jgi:hypothetical protein
VRPVQHLAHRLLREGIRTHPPAREACAATVRSAYPVVPQALEPSTRRPARRLGSGRKFDTSCRPVRGEGRQTLRSRGGVQENDAVENVYRWYAQGVTGERTAARCGPRWRADDGRGACAARGCPLQIRLVLGELHVPRHQRAPVRGQEAVPRPICATAESPATVR